MIHVTDRVNHKPLFKKGLLNDTVLLGENVTFEVTIISDLHRSTTWIRQRCLNDTDPMCKPERIQVMEVSDRMLKITNFEGVNNLVDLIKNFIMKFRQEENKTHQKLTKRLTFLTLGNES